jgi:hypothetical protein
VKATILAAEALNLEPFGGLGIFKTKILQELNLISHLDLDPAGIKASNSSPVSLIMVV